MALNTESTVGQWVAQKPNLARVFEKHGIDYCCGGKRPLWQACQDRKLDPNQVLEELQAALPADDVPAERDWTTAPLVDVINHVQQKHHAYLWRELPRLDYMTGKVAAAHGERHPELLELRVVFHAFREEM